MNEHYWLGDYPKSFINSMYGKAPTMHKIRSVWIVVTPTLGVWQWERGKFDNRIEAERPVGLDEIIRMTDMIRHNCNPKPGDHFMLYTMRSTDSDSNVDYVSSLTPVKRIVWKAPQVDFDIKECWDSE